MLPPHRPLHRPVGACVVGKNLWDDEPEPSSISLLDPSKDDATPVRRRPPASGTSPVVEEPGPGQVLFGRYEVVRQLGRGGFGTVWLVRHRVLHSECVLKLLHPRG